MKFLAPVGGFYDESFGILTTPGHRGIPIGIKKGMMWAADNQAFTKEFVIDKFRSWLNTMWEYKDTCLFVTCPDKVGDANRTLDLFHKWRGELGGWNIAYVAQDGQENKPYPYPSQWQTLFIGGSTEWKMSDGAIECIKFAQEWGKHIHIGRVNYMRRYRHFASLNGSEEFTCDGTRNRFEGSDKAIREWRKYMDSPKQYGLFVSGSDSNG